MKITFPIEEEPTWEKIIIDWVCMIIDMALAAFIFCMMFKLIVC